jgi:hypothetical protein
MKLRLLESLSAVQTIGIVYLYIYPAFAVYMVNFLARSAGRKIYHNSGGVNFPDIRRKN